MHGGADRLTTNCLVLGRAAYPYVATRRVGDAALCLSKQIGMRAGAGEGQDEDVVFNSVEQQPVGRNVAVSCSLQVAGKCMVVVLRGKCFACCKDIDHGFKFVEIGTSLEHFLEFLSELLCSTDCVLHDSRNSLSFAGSLQDGAFGSCAMRFASSIASRVISCGVFLCPSLKGISPTSMHFLKKHVMAVVRFMPISEKNSSASALRSSSIRMDRVVVMAFCPFCVENADIVRQIGRNVNAEWHIGRAAYPYAAA